MRNEDRDAKLAALHAGLRGMFDTLVARPVPDRIRSVVEQVATEPAIKPVRRPGRLRR